MINVNGGSAVIVGTNESIKEEIGLLLITWLDTHPDDVVFGNLVVVQKGA